MRHISIATVLLAFLSGPFNSLAFAQAASLDKRYTVNLRPRSLDIRQRSIDEYRVLVERQAIPSCGDASGNPVDVHNLVSSSVAAGLPKASDAGVVFMEAVITAQEACGPYACFVSSDATGTSWANMVMLQNIPKVSEGCAANGAEEKYTLVASFPPDTSCSGPDGACLVMCKAEAMSLGNCAAVAWEQPSASASTSDTAVFNNTSAVTALVNTTQTQTTTYTTTDHLSYQAVTPPSSLTTSSTFVWGKAAPTLRGFSGDNGPGGPSEQHLKFELSATSDTPANITATSGTQSLHYQAQTAVQLLIVSAGMIWIVL